MAGEVRIELTLAGLESAVLAFERLPNIYVSFFITYILYHNFFKKSNFCFYQFFVLLWILRPSYSSICASIAICLTKSDFL